MSYNNMTKDQLKCEAARKRLYAEQDRLQSVLKKTFPLGRRVLVTHSRGSYYGHVRGHSWSGANVIVCNEVSGKNRGCVYWEVELV